jgi:hypothetical protein
MRGSLGRVIGLFVVMAMFVVAIWGVVGVRPRRPASSSAP